MKELPNNKQAFYREGGVWSLIAGIILVICIIGGYFAIPFQQDERWIYFFMAPPFVVMVIILFKNFFKPTAVFITSPQGIKFHAMNRLFGNPIKLPWNKIRRVYYEKQKTHNGYVEVFVFETTTKRKETFNLFCISSEDRTRLRQIFSERLS